MTTVAVVIREQRLVLLHGWIYIYMPSYNLIEILVVMFTYSDVSLLLVWFLTNNSPVQ